MNWRGVAFAALSVTVTACSLAVSTNGLSSGGSRDDSDGGPDGQRERDGSEGSDGASKDGDVADGGSGDGGATCPSPVDPSLIVHYTFDEGAGAKLTDCSTHHLDADIHGTPAWIAVAPRVGSHAFTFDGTTTCAELPRSPLLDLSGKTFTVSTWVFPKTFSNGSSGKFIFAKTTDSGSLGFRFATDEGAIVNLAFGQASGTNTGVNAAAPASGWFHAAISYDPTTATTRAYVNGALAKTRTMMPSMIEDPSITAHLGCRADGSNLLDATLDDFRVYDRVLTAEQVSALAQ